MLVLHQILVRFAAEESPNIRVMSGAPSRSRTTCQSGDVNRLLIRLIYLRGKSRCFCRSSAHAYAQDKDANLALAVIVGMVFGFCGSDRE